jgi:DNA-binding CsgD family transcriptional regulator
MVIISSVPVQPDPPRSSAVADRVPGRARRPPQRLTPREVVILRLLVAGMTADAIGNVEAISPRTVRKHLEHIYRKLDVDDRLLAARRAWEEGLV